MTTRCYVDGRVVGDFLVHVCDRAPRDRIGFISGYGPGVIDHLLASTA